MPFLRIVLAVAFAFYTLDVPALLHAMDAHEHVPAHADEPAHQHDESVPQNSEASDLSHLHCLSCVNGVQVLNQAPVLIPVAGRLHSHFVPVQFVPPQPCASIFHPPA